MFTNALDLSKGSDELTIVLTICCEIINNKEQNSQLMETS